MYLSSSSSRIQGGCRDDDAGLKAASDGKASGCKVAAAYCDHWEHGQSADPPQIFFQKPILFSL